MRRRAAFVLSGLSALCGASCLPDPAPRATVSITLRGGDRHLVSEDGFTVDLERRVIVGGVSTSTSIAGGSSGGAYVRDLDTAPFELPDIRAKSSRYVVAYVTSYYDRRERGPGVTDADIAALSGAFAGEGARTGVSSFVLTGTFAKGGKTWRFDWHASAYESVVCGRRTVTVPEAIAFLPDAHVHLDVLTRTERFFVVSGATPSEDGSPSEGSPGYGFRIAPFVAADADDDGVITWEETNAAGLRLVTTDPLFEVSLDGEPLVCAVPGADIPIGF